MTRYRLYVTRFMTAEHARTSRRSYACSVCAQKRFGHPQVVWKLQPKLQTSLMRLRRRVCDSCAAVRGRDASCAGAPSAFYGALALFVKRPYSARDARSTLFHGSLPHATDTYQSALVYARSCSDTLLTVASEFNRPRALLAWLLGGLRNSGPVQIRKSWRRDRLYRSSVPSGF